MQVVAVIENLLADLDAALPDAQVIYGKRGSVTATRDQTVWIQDARLTPSDVVQGDVIEQLDYDIEVIYSATRRGPADQLSAAGDVLTMWQTGVAAIRAMPRPAGVHWIRPTGPVRLSPVASKEAREAAVSSIVQVREDY